MYKVPLKNPNPDIDNFIKVKISVELLGLDWTGPLENKNTQEKYLKNYIEFWYRMGYENLS